MGGPIKRAALSLQYIINELHINYYKKQMPTNIPGG